MNLSAALRADARLRLAIVGAGGKTSALFQLARQMSPPVIVTTSTHLGAWQLGAVDHRHTVSAPADVRALAREAGRGVTLITGATGADGRTQTLSAAVLDEIHALAEALGAALLVEADGSRQKPLKAPAAHEPAIPAWANCTLVMAGLSALGKPLSGETVYRAEIFAALSGLQPGEPVSADALARYLLAPDGGLKHIPGAARRVVLLNQADSPALREEAEHIARQLSGSYDAVLVGALGEADEAQQVVSVSEPVAGVVLAAGAARRFGAPKVLATWRGRALVWHAARAALLAGLQPVVVISGALHAETIAALEDLPVRVVQNPAWQSGQSSSVRTGLAALPPGCGAAVFLLGDQPLVPERVIARLRDAHTRTLAPVITPVVAGRRANPVLFDRSTFADLLALQGDVGGRAVFAKFDVHEIAMDEPLLLVDVDTPEDLQRLRVMGAP